MKKFFWAVLCIVIGIALACSQSQSETYLGKISLSVIEPLAKPPVEARIFITNKDTGLEKTRPKKYYIDPEEEFTIDHRITNSGPEDRVVELVPTILMDFRGAIGWKVRPYSAEAKYQFVPNPQGPAHLLLQEGGIYHIIVALTFPEAYKGTSVSVFLNVNSTKCTEIESCPWGHQQPQNVPQTDVPERHSPNPGGLSLEGSPGVFFCYATLIA